MKNCLKMFLIVFVGMTFFIGCIYGMIWTGDLMFGFLEAGKILYGCLMALSSISILSMMVTVILSAAEVGANRL